METKVCTQCGGEPKPLDQFGNDKRSKDGKGTQCIICVKENRHDYYLRNKQEIIEKVNQYQKNNIDKSRTWKKNHKYVIHEWQKKRNSTVQKLYYAKNKEKVESKRRLRYANTPELKTKNQNRVNKWRLDNPEKVKKLRENNYLNNRDKIKTKVANWAKGNRDRANATKNNYDARKRNNGGYHSHLDWSALKETFNFTCLHCGKKEPEIKLTKDHITPISKGGSNDISNIQPLCQSCNSSKSAKHIDYRELVKG